MVSRDVRSKVEKIKLMNKSQIELFNEHFINPLRQCNKKLDMALRGEISMQDAVQYNESYHKWLKSFVISCRGESK